MSGSPPPPSWDDLAAAVVAGLEREAAAIELEQAVRGLDARAELELHPLLHDALRAAGFGVYPEERFPRDRGKRRRSEGSRCDIVVTPGGRPLADARAQGELFVDAGAIDLADAVWIEVKAVAQFREHGPSRAYAAALQRPVWRDVDKLAQDPGIVHAAVLLILFTADLATADHDLEVWALRAGRQGLPLWPRVTRSLSIGDRLGNRCATAALFPIERWGRGATQ